MFNIIIFLPIFGHHYWGGRQRQEELQQLDVASLIIEMQIVGHYICATSNVKPQQQSTTIYNNNQTPSYDTHQTASTSLVGMLVVFKMLNLHNHV